jgi:hypothetical protein
MWSIRINSVASAMYISIWLCEPGSFRLQGIVVNNYILKKQHIPASFISAIVKFQS